ncbi:MAG: YIP1 family protein [Planctomycetes bacterium]|nr:YIP1 family protein [Planctomycetota bacterium]
MDEGDRNGPPWERDGASPGSWFATVKEIFSGPPTAFRHMRRTGGIAAPLWFGVIGGTLGGWAQLLYDLIVGLVAAPAPPPQFGGNQPPFVDFMQGGTGIFESICGAVLMPIFAAIGLFIFAGVVHLMLMMLDGARHGFEATFRSIAYVSGTTSLLQIIPFCGQIGLVGQAGACFSLILLVVQIVFFILALIEMQGISGGKATAAVLLPFLICCGLCCGLIALFSVGAAGAFR